MLWVILNIGYLRHLLSEAWREDGFDARRGIYIIYIFKSTKSKSETFSNKNI